MTKNMTEGHPLKLIMMFALPLLLGSVQFLVLGFCIGICCGFGIPIAQSFGGNNLSKMRDFIYHSIVLTIIIGTLLTVGCCLLCMTIIHILQIPSEIASRSYIYLLIIFIGLPCTLLYKLCSSIFLNESEYRSLFCSACRLSSIRSSE